jgi:SecD/SecF fusion protein
LVLFGTELSGHGQADSKPDAGTHLIYEIDDADRQGSQDLDKLAAAVKRRIDPAGLEKALVKPIGKTRVEISIPRGPNREQRVLQVKELLATTGLLEFRIVANGTDDAAGIEAATRYFSTARNGAQAKAALDRIKATGAPPSPLRLPGGQAHAKGYTWFELGRAERVSLRLDGSPRADPNADAIWTKLAKARENGEMLILPGRYCLFSRTCGNQHLSPKEREEKKIEYFALCRDPDKNPKTGDPMRITGEHITRASPAKGAGGRPVVAFHFDRQGAEWFHDLTSKNTPTTTDGKTFRRRLAIILDGQIVSAPTLNSPVEADGVIAGNFTNQEVDRLVTLLRAGALPVSLKPVPVVEEEVKPDKH